MEDKIPGLAGGRTLAQFLDKEPADAAAFVRQRIEATELSPAFREALQRFGRTTLLVYAYLDCPDCRAVVPVLAKIPSANPEISLVMADWNDDAERFLEEHLGTGRAPTVLALNAQGRLMDGAFIERPLETHKATANAASKRETSKRETMIAIGAFRNGGRNEQIERDLLKVLNGEKIDVLPYLQK